MFDRVDTDSRPLLRSQPIESYQCVFNQQFCTNQIISKETSPKKKKRRYLCVTVGGHGLGHIAPAILDTSGEEMRKLLPDGVLHVGLTISEPIQTLGTEQAASAFARMVDAGKKLAAERVDVLICGGAPVALSKGPSGDAELAELLRRETQLPVVTANGSVVDALRLLGARSVLAVSPFIEARNQEIRAFLEASGFAVPATKGLGLVKNIDFASQSPKQLSNWRAVWRATIRKPMRFISPVRVGRQSTSSRRLKPTRANGSWLRPRQWFGARSEVCRSWTVAPALAGSWKACAAAVHRRRATEIAVHELDPHLLATTT